MSLRAAAAVALGRPELQAGPRYRIRAEHPDGGQTWFRADYLAASALAHDLHDHGWPSVSLYAPDGRRCYAIERGREG